MRLFRLIGFVLRAPGWLLGDIVAERAAQIARSAAEAEGVGDDAR